MNRRNLLKLAGTAAAVGATMAIPASHKVFAQAATGPFTLPPLGYAYDALEPHIDKMTMEIHHTRHHAAFLATINNAAQTYRELTPANTEKVLRGLSDVPENLRMGVRNTLGGYWNHVHFWDIMTPAAPSSPRAPSPPRSTPPSATPTSSASSSTRRRSAASDRAGPGSWWAVTASWPSSRRPTRTIRSWTASRAWCSASTCGSTPIT